MLNFDLCFVERNVLVGRREHQLSKVNNPVKDSTIIHYTYVIHSYVLQTNQICSELLRKEEK